MKIRTIVLFIFSVLGLLALISYLFPQPKVSIGNVNLKFPPLAEVLMAEKDEMPADTVPEDTLTTEELLQIRMDALKSEKESEFMAYCQNNPARIYMPEGDMAYLDPFFDALEVAETKPMRIMHYGDSQLEGDRISSVLREAFQAKFGGSGVGLIPAIQTVPTYTLSQSAVPAELPRYLVYGPKNMWLENKQYGAMGQVAILADTTLFTLSSRSRDSYPYASRFSRVTVMTDAPIEAFVLGKQDTLQLNETILNDQLRMYTGNLGAARTSANLRLHGQANIYGIMLDGNSGVSLDNIPMRGCSGTIFTNIASSTIAPFYAHKNVKLIILQYGGNSVPYLKGKDNIAQYMKSLKRQVEYLKQQAPQACFLFIGPSDMSTSIDGEMQTYPILPQTVKALKEMAGECGIAYWDLYAAMGGRNSMIKWVDSFLAGPDYVHFTPKGARHIGNILYETLEFYHKFYRFRTGKDPLKLEADTTATATDSAALVP